MSNRKTLKRSLYQAMCYAVLFWLYPVLIHAQNDDILENPLRAKTTISSLLISLTQWLLGLVGTLALLALIVGGIKYIISFGREDSIASAKKIIFWAIAGLIVVFASYLVVTTTQGILNQ